MNITLQPVLNSEFELLFSVVKTGIYPYVDSVFGWCDDYQKNRLINDYELNWFYWIYANQTRVGMLCFKQYDNSYHVHLLIIFPEFQNQNLGQATMGYVHKIANSEHRDSVTLSSFVNNVKAVKFYERLGYEVIDRDEDFLSLSLKLSS